MTSLSKWCWCALLLTLGVVLTVPTAQSKPPAGKKKAKAAAAEASPAPEATPSLEPKAVDILKAASSKLTAARTLKFTGVHFYENPSRHDLESVAVSLMTPPNFGSGGGSCFPSMVVVAPGEPGVPVVWICARAEGATVITAAANIP